MAIFAIPGPWGKVSKELFRDSPRQMTPVGWCRKVLSLIPGSPREGQGGLALHTALHNPCSQVVWAVGTTPICSNPRDRLFLQRVGNTKLTQQGGARWLLWHHCSLLCGRNRLSPGSCFCCSGLYTSGASFLARVPGWGVSKPRIRDLELNMKAILEINF